MKTWAERIEDLEAAGLSLTAIATEIVLSPQSLSDIKHGRSREPRGMAAVRLHAMHERLEQERGPVADKSETRDAA